MKKARSNSQNQLSTNSTLKRIYVDELKESLGESSLFIRVGTVRKFMIWWGEMAGKVPSFYIQGFPTCWCALRPRVQGKFLLGLIVIIMMQSFVLIGMLKHTRRCYITFVSIDTAHIGTLYVLCRGKLPSCRGGKGRIHSSKSGPDPQNHWARLWARNKGSAMAWNKAT